MMKFFFALLALFAIANAQYQCAECTFVVQTVESWIESNSTLAELQQKFDAVCEQVPAFSTACETIVAYGLPYFVAYVQNETPDKVCKQIGLCSTPATATATQTSVVARPQVFFQESYQCVGCQYLVSALEAYVLSAANPASVEKQLEQLCSYVPSFQTACDQIVDAGVQNVLKWVETENSTVVCQKLKACSVAAPTSTSNMRPLVSFNDIACEACQVAVSTAEQYLLNGNTLKQVAAKVDALFCNQLPSAFTATCDAFVQQGLEQALKVANSETPATACAQLKVCPNTVATSAVRPIMFKN